MKTYNKAQITTSLLVIVIAAIATISNAAHASGGDDDGTTTQLTQDQWNQIQAQAKKNATPAPAPGYDPTQEGLDTSLTVNQWDTVRVWMGSSKSQLLGLLESVEPMPDGQAKTVLMQQISAIVKSSDPKATETMMRYALNRGMDIVNQIDLDGLADVSRPGVLDQEVRVLKRMIGFALEYYQDDLKYLNSVQNGLDDLISPPRAEFGVRCAQFVMKLNRSLLASRAQYKIAFDALGRLSVDLWNDDGKSAYGDAMGKIYLFQQSHKAAPKTSRQAIEGLREIEEEFQQVLQSLRQVKSIAGAIVSDQDIATE